jgi:hypothetical protein
VILGAGVVWWVRPDNPAGVALIVVVSTLLCFALGAIASLAGHLLARRDGAGGKGDRS